MFWRETGMKDEDEEVEAREGACSMETAMVVRGAGVSRAWKPRSGRTCLAKGLQSHEAWWADRRGGQRRLGVRYECNASGRG